MSVHLPRLDLTCFGPPTALVDGREPAREVLWQKHLGLLIYLALSPAHRRTRTHLVSVFWPEMPEQRARKALNEAVLRLRKRLGAVRLRTERDALVLDPAGLEVDALQFAAAVARSPAEAPAFLRGDFLEGFSVGQATAFEDWADAERARYRALGADAFVAAGEKLLSESRLTEAGNAARRALGYAPYSEPAVRLLMRAGALAADAGSALASFKEFAQRLEGELSERPSPALV